MKPAVIYFINFSHVAVIKLRERCRGKLRETRNHPRLSLSLSLFLISLYFFPRLSGIHGVVEVALRRPRRTPAADKLTNFRRTTEVAERRLPDFPISIISPRRCNA
jgi:hypothetical protein